MHAQDSTINSSSDDESMSQLFLSKPKTQYSALKWKKEIYGWPSEMLIGCGACVCAVIIALLSTIGYAIFIHIQLLHLESLVQKLQTGLEGNSSDPSLKNVRMTSSQIEKVKMLNDMTDLSQFQDNLSSVHLQFLTLQRFYKDMEENPNIIQFLRSITEQLTPLSQSVVLMSDGLHDIQKSVEVIEVDHHTLMQSVDGLNRITHYLQSSINALHNVTRSIESRLSIVELLQPAAVGLELNSSSMHAQLKNGPSLELDRRMKDLQAQILNTSQLVRHLEERVRNLQVDLAQLKNIALDEKPKYQLESRISALEGKLNSILENEENLLNTTMRISSDVHDDVDTVERDVDEESPASPNEY